MKKPPPLYLNFDDTHCCQCVYGGVLEYFEPGKKWSWEELDAFTGKDPDKWTWPYRGIINAVNRGYDVVHIDNVNVQTYLDDGVYETLLSQLGKEAADMCREKSDLVNVKLDIVDYMSVLADNKFQEFQRVPTMQDLKKFIEEGYLVHCILNSKKLQNKQGYSSHSVLIYDMDDTYVYFNESNLPGILADKSVIDDFMAACIDPTPNQWALTAYRLA